jgi:hypothetical protein
MTLKAVVVAAVLLVCCGRADAARLQQGAAPNTEVRITQLEQWLTALVHHSPGLIDDELVTVGTRSNADLQTLALDVTTLIRILRNPSLLSYNATFVVSTPREQTGRAPLQVVRYTPRQLTRLKQLACAVGGVLDAAPCEWMKAAMTSDSVLSSLSSAATAIRTDLNGNFIARRGALMHSDVVMMGLTAPSAVDLSPSQPAIRMTFSDGQQTSLMQPGVHWEVARQLMDLVAGPGSTKPAPGGDDMVRRWYVATSAWLQMWGHHDNDHIGRGREIFPDDADLAMLAGAQHEAYAASAVQTAVRQAVLPTGIKLEVRSERDELKDAERLLRRATELKPGFAEAQIRLGRVLSLSGRDMEAADHLRKGLEGTDEKLLRYFASLFLGAAEERLGHAEASQASYEQAASLFPSAQSPLLGLSELAHRAGHRDEALRDMEKVYSLGSSGNLDTDPWWQYTYLQGRHADALLEALQQPFRLAGRQ